MKNKDTNDVIEEYREEGTAPENAEEPKPLKEFLDWIKIIVIAVVAALLINNLLIINSVVPSGSMENTIMPGDRVIGFRLSYKFADPERGDIIIFKYPDNESQTFVKRVIGIGGDLVEIKEGVTYVNGVELDEPYLKDKPKGDNYGPYEVPEGCYFAMGDNRNYSKDSRFWNNTYVEKKKILGKAIFRYWPLNSIGTVK